MAEIIPDTPIIRRVSMVEHLVKKKVIPNEMNTNRSPITRINSNNSTEKSSMSYDEPPSISGT